MLRLFVDAALREGASVSLDGDQATWLGRVMRRRVGERFAIFNGRDGEWEAEIAVLERGSGQASVLRRLRPQAASPDVWLAFAPAKRGMADLAVRQTVELGAARILPVTTERSVVDRLNRERLRRIAIEAAEQCGRLEVPEIAPLAPLRDLLAEWPAGRALAACHPGGGALQAGPAPGGLLLGPEGGFAAAELDAFAETGFVRLVDLGPRILRAETAVVAALSMRHAIWGDGA
ncbi:MAG: 16S rRNA (uracil(1498)-N(3))-methyltransferase [Alphaproteobacteria bacterium]|nr:16S rRNA (uracil(1498)-N(3))-methyltransferase [Alphaproteobacteria bacterium]